MVAVDIFVSTLASPHTAIEDASVAVLAEGSLQLQAYGLTDVAGKASFLLPGDADGVIYEVRVFKAGVVFGNPTRISVLEPAVPEAPNQFDAYGTPISHGVPMDPRLCRCVGRFVTYENKPQRNTLVYLTQEAELARKVPKVVDGYFVTPSRMEFRTNNDGFVVVDLYRGGEFRVMVAGEDDEIWQFKVPDLPTANLIDLIHPYPNSFEWGATSPLSVAVGATVQLDTVVTFSDLVERDAELTSLFDFEVADSAICSAMFDSTTKKLTILGIAPGTTTLSMASRTDVFPVRYPAPSLTVSPLTIVVTP